MAKRMQFSVVGLPHYTVWHLYEPSVDDIRHMEEMEQERRNRENEERERAERAKKIKDEFGDTGPQWDKDKSGLADINQKEEQIRKEHDAAIAAQEKEKGSDLTSGKGSPVAKEVNKGIKGEEKTDKLGSTSSGDGEDAVSNRNNKDAKSDQESSKGSGERVGHDSKAGKASKTEKDDGDQKVSDKMSKPSAEKTSEDGESSVNEPTNGKGSKDSGRSTKEGQTLKGDGDVEDRKRTSDSTGNIKGAINDQPDRSAEKPSKEP